MNDSLTGTQVAGYRVERLLGRGGMASVYFAWDIHRDRAVALKVMDERYRETPAYVDRFIQEAQTIASWDHPNIVRVLDAGEEGGIYFYAMEFIRGLDLAQLLRQYLDAGQLLPYDEVVRLCWAVAGALDFAHARGIIHRDVKPSNVLISVDSRVLLSDFGLVMDVSRGTMGETFGSPQYIAPEQARSSAGAVPQSDLYALGVMMFEMLTGSLPFTDSSPTSLALKHVNEPPPRPRSLNPRLNAGVEAVLLRALRKRPEERYATGREMMLALERALGGELHDEAATQPQPLPTPTERLHNAPPPPPPAGATAYYPASQQQPPPVRPAASYTSRAPAGAPAAGGPPYVPPNYQSRPAAAVPPQPRRRSGLGGLGCLAVFLALGALVLVIGAALAFNNPDWVNRTLASLMPIQEQPAPPPTDAPPPTATFTLAPSQTLPPTATGTTPPTETPQPTETPAPTATPAPTETPIPTATPLAYSLLMARRGNDGFALINNSELPVALARLEFVDNQQVFSGELWEVEQLEPGQCVFAWEPDTQPRMPSGIECQQVGEIPIRAGNQRFWTHNIEVRYAGEPVASCRSNRDRCDIEFLFQP